jgi:general secretion pathway protein D
MSRNTDSRTSISTQVASTGGSGQGTTGGGSAAGGSGNSNSTTQVVNKSSNQFWDTLVQNVKDILRETDKLLPEGSSITTTQETSTQSTTGTGAAAAAAARARATAPANLAGSPNPAAMATEGERVVARVNYREAASVIANAETGVLAVRATSKQHEKIQEFLDRVLSNARRQVLIEATVIQVQLSDQYQQGIDWSVLRHGSSGFTFRQAPVGNPPPSVASGLFTLGYAAPNSPLANISATIQLLETFGTLKVLSSPKISVLNNQTALLKVVQNLVYFNIQVTPGTTSAGGQTTQPTYTTTAATVPVGFVMSVTPHISDSDEVTLNVRPTISRRIRDVPDPNPALRLDANGNALPIPAVNNVPVIETKEMESILKISSGQIAVMGGLMEDVVNNTDNRVPGLADLPVVGSFFNYKDNISSKSELVIFLRPIVVKDASLSGDYSSFTSMLPGPDYFKEDPTRGVVRKP